jgi:hypothetical protein
MKNVISNILQVTLICSAVAAIILSIIYIEQNHSKPKTNEFNESR